MQVSVPIYPILLCIALVAIMVICVKAKKLTISAALVAGLIGSVVYLGAAERGIFLLLTFFILGVLATSYKKEAKAGIFNEEVTAPRTTGQVLANGGAAGILGLLAFFNPEHANIYQLMMAASLASALADTLSSELGVLYGKRFFNILTFKRDTKGSDGVISFEGTLIGAFGALLIALIYAGLSKLSLIVTLAGIIGNMLDSILGAALERKQLLNNNAVNFLNTSLAAIVACALANV
ncbi:DUF92 domain-containing protein [Pedobacter duraquae]|uniref:Uncharacterized protein (TIGR00297 family) n=1 Tax=Pedobacter duraquae TaxID=425511 RepID=A0A4R6IP67_9SPHI|nr:DUF92 domain-containing protein [Pedobacter duraquae]TDO23931.1 uncharacterized protein (TIGR00297 family) [Pedobacter duraquae]